MNRNEETQSDSISRRNLLVEKHLPIARCVAWRVIRNVPPNVEYQDVFQTAAVGLIHAAEHYSPSLGIPPAAYAYRCARKAAIQSVRGRQSPHHLGQLSTEIMDERSFKDVDEQLNRNQLKRLVAEILRAIPPKEQEVVTLHYFLDMTFTEIARHCRIGVNKASLLHRSAKVRLMRELRCRLPPRQIERIRRLVSGAPL